MLWRAAQPSGSYSVWLEKDISIPIAPGKDNNSRGTYLIKIIDGQKRLCLVGLRYPTWFKGILGAISSILYIRPCKYQWPLVLELD
jgi:hypothetical protein